MKALGYQIALDDFQLSRKMDVLLALRTMSKSISASLTATSAERLCAV